MISSSVIISLWFFLCLSICLWLSTLNSLQSDQNLNCLMEQRFLK
jgi:hypothetical protein